jgi:hypothetical protein
MMVVLSVMVLGFGFLVLVTGGLREMNGKEMYLIYKKQDVGSCVIRSIIDAAECDSEDQAYRIGYHRNAVLNRPPFPEYLVVEKAVTANRKALAREVMSDWEKRNGPFRDWMSSPPYLRFEIER